MKLHSGLNGAKGFSWTSKWFSCMMFKQYIHIHIQEEKGKMITWSKSRLLSTPCAAFSWVSSPQWACSIYNPIFKSLITLHLWFYFLILLQLIDLSSFFLFWQYLNRFNEKKQRSTQLFFPVLFYFLFNFWIL